MTTEITTTEAVAEVRSRSVVAPAYKVRYRERAQTAKLPKGADRKTIARSNGDWLALILARETVTKRKSDRAKVAAILEANGIDHSRWAHLDNGRFRMTGGLALRTKIVENGVLALDDERTETPPKAWIARWEK